MVELADFDRWVAEVRDPATQSREGWRTLGSARGKARAAYEIAPLPGGRFAVRIKVEFLCGNVSSLGTPWRDFDTREECIAYFLEVARSHFATRQVAMSQEKARERMAALLAGPFREPKPETIEPPDTTEQDRAEAARKEARAADAERFPLFAEQIDRDE